MMRLVLYGEGHEYSTDTRDHEYSTDTRDIQRTRESSSCEKHDKAQPEKV